MSMADRDSTNSHFSHRLTLHIELDRLIGSSCDTYAQNMRDLMSIQRLLWRRVLLAKLFFDLFHSRFDCRQLIQNEGVDVNGVHTNGARFAGNLVDDRLKF